MSSQLINNWNDFYSADRIPQWEDLSENEGFCKFVLGYANPNMRILEIGAGLGFNAMWLSAQGLNITASDISENAMVRCETVARDRGLQLKCKVFDIFGCMEPGKFNLIYDKGCWHTFFDSVDRRRFASVVAKLLEDDGLWVSSCGSADQIDAYDDPHVVTYPRISLLNIATAAEEFFEVIQIRQGLYGFNDDRNFKTWECAFRKRSIKSIRQRPH